MTTPRYQQCCAAGSQERRERRPRTMPGASISTTATSTSTTRTTTALSGSSVAFPPVSVGVGFVELYDACERARRKKKPSHNQLSFEVKLGDGLVELEDQINAMTWEPSPTTCFIASKPKAREIHAPDFSDRVVHHWLVPQLSAIYQPLFCHHSYSNQKGKGTHAAVRALTGFVRQVYSGQGRGWFLQLDIFNFFNSIHRRTLYEMVKRRMVKHGVSEFAQRVVHALLHRSPRKQKVIYRATSAQRASVPWHKRLENAAPGCGIPIGNLPSQFFANVYMDVFDQFIKHVLKVKRYLRYVDDFVLVHESRAQLLIWQRQIETFLREQLRLELKPDIRLQPLSAGIDFLGYIVYPTHTCVRRRVIGHAREKLSEWHRVHVGPLGRRPSPEALQQVRSTWSSYHGHFGHANSFRLRRDFHRRYPWLADATNNNRMQVLAGKEFK